MAVLNTYAQSNVSTSNHTANYDLPLWADGDKTSWLEQVNDAMNKIDDGILDAKTEALKVVGLAADAKKIAEETKAESEKSAKIVETYNKRLTTAEGEIVEHTDDITELNTRCNQIDVEIHSLQETQKKTTEDLGTLSDKVNTNATDIVNLKASVKVNEDNISKLTDRTTTVEAGLDVAEQDISTLYTKVGLNTTNIETLKGNVKDLTDSTSTLNTLYKNLEKTVDNHDTRITKVESDVANLVDRVDDHDTDITGLDTRVTTNTTNLSDVTARVVVLESSSSQYGKDIDALNDSVESLNASMSTADGRIEALETDNITNKSNISTLQNEVAELEKLPSKVTQNITDIASIQTEQQTQNAEIASNGTAIASNGNNIRALYNNLMTSRATSSESDNVHYDITRIGNIGFMTIRALNGFQADKTLSIKTPLENLAEDGEIVIPRYLSTVLNFVGNENSPTLNIQTPTTTGNEFYLTVTHKTGKVVDVEATIELIVCTFGTILK